MKLTERESLVLQAKLMYKSDYTAAIKWLNSKGEKMKQTTYYMILKDIESRGAERLFNIGKTFQAFHADEIEKFLMIESQMYEQYHAEETPTGKARILKMIADIQPMITALYDSTQYVVEANARFLSGQEKTAIIPA